MRITDSNQGVFPLPASAARAYGIRQPHVCGDYAGMIRPVTRQDAANLSPQVQNLVAGGVTQSASFDPVRPTAPSHAFQMYARVADKIEAAVAVRSGQTVDFRA